MCEQKDWDGVWNELSDRKSHGAQTAGVTEVRSFYELGEDCLWITFSDGHLYWAFAHLEVQLTGTIAVIVRLANASRWMAGIRLTFAGNHSALAHSALKLTKVANFRATICKVGEEDLSSTTN